MDRTQVITDYTQQFLSKFNFSHDIAVSVSFNEPENRYDISLQTADPSLLIGFHGETITALQAFLNQHFHSQFGEWLSINVNVNDYNERRERSLYDLADSTVIQVLSTHRPYALPPLTPSERRLIHVYLANHPQVSTSSEGEGRSRTLIISPKV